MTAVAFKAVIPARHASTRFPGKPLVMLAGRSMVERVHAAAMRSGAQEVWVATDDERIVAACRGFTDQVMVTSAEHRTGTDRVAEVAARRSWADDTIVVNVQGDSPLVPVAGIARAAALLQAHPGAAIGTVCCPIRDPADYENPNIVKAVFDRDGRAMYFSRAPIPSRGHGAPVPESFRHMGIYAYRVGALRRLAASREECPLETAERLEQLRAMWLGMEIRIAALEVTPGPDVDVPADVEAVTAWLARHGDTP
jgi:3-deoxy-manno-octulosonate cytidylyltransferase (CMP-KDO synthetase)